MKVNRQCSKEPARMSDGVSYVQAMFGWVGSHTSGLFADETEIIDDADSSGERSIEDKYARQSGEVASAQSTISLVLKCMSALIH